VGKWVVGPLDTPGLRDQFGLKLLIGGGVQRDRQWLLPGVELFPAGVLPGAVVAQDRELADLRTADVGIEPDELLFHVQAVIDAAMGPETEHKPVRNVGGVEALEVFKARDAVKVIPAAYVQDRSWRVIEHGGHVKRLPVRIVAAVGKSFLEEVKRTTGRGNIRIPLPLGGMNGSSAASWLPVSGSVAQIIASCRSKVPPGHHELTRSAL
jgi:hypothetical protein